VFFSIAHRRASRERVTGQISLIPSYYKNFLLRVVRQARRLASFRIDAFSRASGYLRAHLNLKNDFDKGETAESRDMSTSMARVH